MYALQLCIQQQKMQRVIEGTYMIAPMTPQLYVENVCTCLYKVRARMTEVLPSVAAVKVTVYMTY